MAAACLAVGHARRVSGQALLNLSFARNYALGGLDVIGYHVFNLLVHLTAALLLLGLARRTFQLPGMPEGIRQAAGPLATAVAISGPCIRRALQLGSRAVAHGPAGGGDGPLSGSGAERLSSGSGAATITLHDLISLSPTNPAPIITKE